MNTMAGVTPSIMECRNYSVQDIMNIYGVGEESVRNFIKKHQKNNDFQINSYSHNIPPGKITLSFKHIQVTQNYDN